MGTSEVATASSDVERFLAEPSEFFDRSFTRMQSMPREQLNELQRRALSRRFEQMVETIPMLAKLAGRQGIIAVTEFEQVVPLLFEHTMYKSYPLVFLERAQFDKMTVWLDKLTTADLSDVDTSGCDSIDGWLDKVASDSSLDLSHSSGTSGTMSFFPWSVRDLIAKGMTRRVSELQTFGEEPSREVIEDPIHFFGMTNRQRYKHLDHVFAVGQPGFCHMRNPNGLDADLMWLAARLRLAAAKGDASRVDVPDRLLARRDSLKHAHAEENSRHEQWVQAMADHQNERVLLAVFVHMLYGIVQERRAKGDTSWSFAPGSGITMAGGTKGHELASDWKPVLEDFFGIPMRQAYGMTELSGYAMECTEGRLHIPPWVIPYVLDPETSELLPRSGSQRGRAALFDLLPESHWGGLMTGDEIEVEFDALCPCGASTLHMDALVGRLTDKRGGDDKITCSASPLAHAEAMDFLVGY